MCVQLSVSFASCICDHVCAIVSSLSLVSICVCWMHCVCNCVFTLLSVHLCLLNAFVVYTFFMPGIVLRAWWHEVSGSEGMVLRAWRHVVLAGMRSQALKTCFERFVFSSGSLERFVSSGKQLGTIVNICCSNMFVVVSCGLVFTYVCCWLFCQCDVLMLSCKYVCYCFFLWWVDIIFMFVVQVIWQHRSLPSPSLVVTPPLFILLQVCVT